MNTKTRFENLPKRDREEVLRIDGLLSSRAPSPEAYTAWVLQNLQNQREHLTKRTPNSLLASALHGLKSYFCDWCIVRRYLDDDLVQLRLGVDSSARLGFLMRIAGGEEYSGGYDCAHVFDLLLALVVEDKSVIDLFLNRFPAPFSSGHPATVLLSNGLYSALNDDQEAFASLEKRLREKKESRFFRAMYDCLLGIMAEDLSAVAASLGEMVKLNRRQEQLNSSMQKLICLTAHAFYNVCRRTCVTRGIAAPVIPDESTWHGDFQELIQSSETENCFIELSSVNPVLARWLKELPATLNIEELLTNDY
ncbi:MAG: hypothetical protein JW818_19725 [Pirellulales bacterium]|nr:hypothetical protein [Pirellulales bacterium]